MTSKTTNCIELNNLFHENLTLNLKTINQIRGVSSLLLGTGAGILGLTSYEGFLFYIAASLMVSTLTWAFLSSHHENQKSFLSPSQLWLRGIVDYLPSFIFTWTLAYSMIRLRHCLGFKGVNETRLLSAVKLQIMYDIAIVARRDIQGLRKLIQIIADHEGNCVTREFDVERFMVLVSFPTDVVRDWLKQSRRYDVLFGVVSASYSLQDNDTNAELDGEREEQKVHEIPLSEKLRIINEKLTYPKDEDGLGIVPGMDNWDFIESINPVIEPTSLSYLERWKYMIFPRSKNIEQIRLLFGEKIALYFAFHRLLLQFFATQAIIGLLANYLLGGFSLLYTISVSICAITFPLFWSRTQHALAIKWGVLHCSRRDNTRRSFKGEGSITDPITGKKKQFFPAKKRAYRTALNIPLALFAIVLFSTLLFSIFAIDVFIVDLYRGALKGVLIYLPMVLAMTVLPLFSGIFERQCSKLTDYQNFEKAHEHSISLLSKTMLTAALIEFLPILLSCFVYIPYGHAWVPRMNSIVTSYLSVPTAAVSESDYRVNNLRAQNQIKYMAVTAQAIQFFTGILLPLIKRICYMQCIKFSKRYKVKSDKTEEHERLERIRSKLFLSKFDTNKEVLGLVHQFGHMILYSGFWPLSPFAYFISNAISIYSKGFKLAAFSNPEMPERIEKFDVYITYMRFLTILASIVNSSLLYLYGRPTTSPNAHNAKTWALSIIAAENIILVVQFFVQILMSTVPHSFNTLKAREDYLIRKKLLDSHDGYNNHVEEGSSTGDNTIKKGQNADIMLQDLNEICELLGLEANSKID